MQKQYIKLKYVVSRQSFEGSLELLLNSEEIECWKKGENKYVGFYESVIEYIATYSEFDRDLEELYPYYSGIFYTPEEVKKIREFGEYIWNWAHPLHPKAAEYQKKYRNYDYVYLTDKSFKQVRKKTKELYNYLKINDEKYDYEKSLNSYLEDDSWFDDDYNSIKKHDYERFFNVILNDNHDLNTPEKIPSKHLPQLSLIEKVKNFTKKLW